MNQAPIARSTKPLPNLDLGFPFWNPGKLGVYTPQHNQDAAGIGTTSSGSQCKQTRLWARSTGSLRSASEFMMEDH